MASQAVLHGKSTTMELHSEMAKLPPAVPVDTPLALQDEKSVADDKPAMREHQATFARNFKAARRAAGMTQLDVARVANSTYQTVSKIERGILNLTLETMDRMARAVGCELVVLLKPDIAPTRR